MNTFNIIIIYFILVKAATKQAFLDQRVGFSVNTRANDRQPK